MPLRILLLVLGAAVLSSCSDYYEDAGQPKMRQHAQTTPAGPTIYTYKPDDQPAN
jgi:hypothetical protein